MTIKRYQPYRSKNLIYETTPVDSYRLSKVKSKNTRPEILLRKELWSKGFRYRKNVSTLPGKPDIVFNKLKLVLFVDGEFWHGYNWSKAKNRFKSNKEYWIPKIEKNIERDIRNNNELMRKGYTVVRIWENEIKKDLSNCVIRVIKIIESMKGLKNKTNE